MPETHLICECIPAAAPLGAEPFLKAIPALRKRLQLDQDEGRERFDKAEALRKAEKWPDAIAAYRDLLKALPACKYAPRADLHVGDCLLGERKPAAAVEHWEKFISAGPGKAWRGQALLGVMDIFLEQQFDLAKARKYATLARPAIEAGLADKDAACAESWRAVAADLCIRGGVTAYVAGNAPEALTWFEDARKHAGGRQGDGIERLVMFIKAARPVLPEEVAGKMDDQAAVVLALGSVYRMAERWEQAGEFFDLVRQTKVRPRNVAQLAYAAFGKGAALDGAGKTADARPLYENAIKGHPGAPWHDETLFRLAWLIERDAEAKYAKENRDAAAKEKDRAAKTDKPATPAERQQAAAEEKKRLAEFLEQRGAALPHWQEMLKRFADSPYATPAKYHAGMLLADAEKWEPAAKALDSFITAAPLSPHAAAAIVRLIDVRLERLFDLPAARAALASADKWCSDYDPKRKAEKPELRDALLSEWDRPASAGELKHAKYDLYLRAGLVAYLDQKYDEAAKLFEAAKPFAPPPDFVVVSGNVSFGLGALLETARSGKTLTPKEIVELRTKESLVLQLADIHSKMEDRTKAIQLLNIVLTRRGKESTAPICVGYALFSRGLCHYRDFEFEEACGRLREAREVAPKASWNDKCLFYEANIRHNGHKCVREAIALWEGLVVEYPKSEHVPSAMLFIGTAYMWDRQWLKAKTAFEDLLRKYPDSPFVGKLRTVNIPRCEKGLRGEAVDF